MNAYPYSARKHVRDFGGDQMAIRRRALSIIASVFELKLIDQRTGATSSARIEKGG